MGEHSTHTPTMAQLSNPSKKPSITIFPSHTLNIIDRNIYSGFTEHMGRCIYGGIYDPSNPNPSLLTPEGFRKDVITTLLPLEIPIFRYPGGNFCATYHWLDGVGPRHLRPSRPNLAWSTTDPNTFGTDEFITWCKHHMHAEPYLCLNFGTGTLDEALAWVEYCNGTSDTHYANLRRQNGHPAPHNVKYWGLGNEMWGDWQICQTTAESYATKAYQWAKALKLLDPSITLILCGKEGPTNWDHTVLTHCIRPAGLTDLGAPKPPLIDMHSIHLYTASASHYENVFAPLAAERAIEICTGLIDLACIENKVPSSQPRPKICFDEWNVWDPRRAPGEKGAEERYSLSDALAVGVWLNVLVRMSGSVGMANIAQSVNVISPLMTSEDGVVKQTSWFVYELFCRFVRGSQVGVVVEGVGEYLGPTRPEWVKGVAEKKMRWLDVSATVDAEWVNLAVVNVNEVEDLEVELVVGGRQVAVSDVDVYTVTGRDVKVTNMDGIQHVKIVESKWSGDGGGGRYTFPKHSFTLLRWRLASSS